MLKATTAARGRARFLRPSKWHSLRVPLAPSAS
jgi:hypothetical protein